MQQPVYNPLLDFATSIGQNFGAGFAQGPELAKQSLTQRADLLGRTVKWQIGQGDHAGAAKTATDLQETLRRLYGDIPDGTIQTLNNSPLIQPQQGGMSAPSRDSGLPPVNDAQMLQQKMGAPLGLRYDWQNLGPVDTGQVPLGRNPLEPLNSGSSLIKGFNDANAAKTATTQPMPFDSLMAADASSQPGGMMSGGAPQTAGTASYNLPYIQFLAGLGHQSAPIKVTRGEQLVDPDTKQVITSNSIAQRVPGGYLDGNGNFVRTLGEKPHTQKVQLANGNIGVLDQNTNKVTDTGEAGYVKPSSQSNRGYNLNPGQTHYDANNQPVATADPKGATFTPAQAEAMKARWHKVNESAAKEYKFGKWSINQAKLDELNKAKDAEIDSMVASGKQVDQASTKADKTATKHDVPSGAMTNAQTDEVGNMLDRVFGPNSLNRLGNAPEYQQMTAYFRNRVLGRNPGRAPVSSERIQQLRTQATPQAAASASPTPAPSAALSPGATKAQAIIDRVKARNGGST